MKVIRSLLSFLLAVVLLFGFGPAALAQSGYGYLEDEGNSLWEEREFMDVSGREFETMDTEYVGEEEIQAAEEAARRAGLPTIDLAAAIEQDKELMPDNIVYGIGTGALIGGWLALVQGETARDNVRFVSIGIVSGVLLALAVGTKSLYLKKVPTASQFDPVFSREGPSLASESFPFRLDLIPSAKDPAAQLSYRLHF